MKASLSHPSPKDLMKAPTKPSTINVKALPRWWFGTGFGFARDADVAMLR
jgi:hypothetical protein